MIRLDAVRYAPDGVPLLDGLSIALAPAATTALVGPSGCGKSTLLRVIAGLRPFTGSITGVPERKAFVFQDPSLLPWLDVRANVALPGRYADIGDVDLALAQVGLEGMADRLPGALSGGQKMRVSLARALVARPRLVLLDEPFAALDGVTRRQVQAVFEALRERERWTVLLVTHELDEAVRLADRVLALAGPPLRVVDDLPVFAPRPRVHADPGTLERLEAAWGQETLDPRRPSG